MNSRMRTSTSKPCSERLPKCRTMPKRTCASIWRTSSRTSTVRGIDAMFPMTWTTPAGKRLARVRRTWTPSDTGPHQGGGRPCHPRGLATPPPEDYTARRFKQGRSPLHQPLAGDQGLLGAFFHSGRSPGLVAAPMQWRATPTSSGIGQGGPVGPFVVSGPCSGLGEDCRMTDKASEISALLAPTVESLGLELLGTEYLPSPGGAVLRLYIDVPAGEA